MVVRPKNRMLLSYCPDEIHVFISMHLGACETIDTINTLRMMDKKLNSGIERGWNPESLREEICSFVYGQKRDLDQLVIVDKKLWIDKIQAIS